MQSSSWEVYASVDITRVSTLINCGLQIGINVCMHGIQSICSKQGFRCYCLWNTQLRALTESVNIVMLCSRHIIP